MKNDNSVTPAAAEVAHTFRLARYGTGGPLGEGLIWGCTVKTVMGLWLFTAYGDTEEEATQYAKNRLRACNAYDSDQKKIKALTEALKGFCDAVEWGQRPGHSVQAGILAAYVRARAALALAKEGQP